MSPQDEPDRLNELGRDSPGRNSADRLPDRSLQPFEAQLASLAPRAVQLDRDRLMFLAGRASVSSGLAESGGRGWGWPAAFSAMSALAAGLLLMLVLRSPRELVTIVQVPAENVQTTDEARADRQNDPVSPSSERVATRESSPPDMFADLAAGRTSQGRPYVELRDRVLAMGLDGWPSDMGRPSEAGASEGRRSQSPAAYHDLLESLLHGG